MSENGEIYTAGKNFTLPPALTGWTNSTSAHVVVNVFSLDIKLKTHQDCHVIYQSTLPSPAELQFLFHF